MASRESNDERVRAIASDQPGVGDHRYRLYTIAWQRVCEASEAGYYLEAITLLESLIADRLESRASYLTGENEGFSNLGPLIRTFRKHETVQAFRDLIERLDSWRKKRNTALHEVVKLEHGPLPSWEKQTASLPSIVQVGKDLLREFADLDEVERAKVGKIPATSPNAFPIVPRSR